MALIAVFQARCPEDDRRKAHATLSDRLGECDHLAAFGTPGSSGDAAGQHDGRGEGIAGAPLPACESRSDHRDEGLATCRQRWEEAGGAAAIADVFAKKDHALFQRSPGHFLGSPRSAVRPPGSGGSAARQQSGPPAPDATKRQLPATTTSGTASSKASETTTAHLEEDSHPQLLGDLITALEECHEVYYDMATVLDRPFVDATTAIKHGLFHHALLFRQFGSLRKGKGPSHDLPCFAGFAPDAIDLLDLMLESNPDSSRDQ